MKNRRSFLAAVASGGVGIALANVDPAVAQSSPSPSPGPSASIKPPSAAAVAVATSMRVRFDPALSDADVQSIANAIDGNADAALTLNPKKKRLKNGDAPAVLFAATGGAE